MPNIGQELELDDLLDMQAIFDAVDRSRLTDEQRYKLHEVESKLMVEIDEASDDDKAARCS